MKQTIKRKPRRRVPIQLCVLLQGEAGELESWVRLFLAGWLGDDGAASTHAAYSSMGQNIPTWVISFHLSNGLNK